MLDARHDATFGDLDGPWDRAFWFGVAVPFQSKSNDRRSNDRRRSATLRDRRVGFNLSVRAAALAARPADWVIGERGQGVADRPVVVGFCFAHTLLDAGNLSKSVYDAVEKVLYVTDASVRLDMSQTARSVAPGENSGVVAFAQLPAGVDPGAVTAAGAALGCAAMSAAAHLFAPR